MNRNFCPFSSIFISASLTQILGIPDFYCNLSWHHRNSSHVSCRVSMTMLYLCSDCYKGFNLSSCNKDMGEGVLFLLYLLTIPHWKCQYNDAVDTMKYQIDLTCKRSRRDTEKLLKWLKTNCKPGKRCFYQGKKKTFRPTFRLHMFFKLTILYHMDVLHHCYSGGQMSIPVICLWGFCPVMLFFIGGKCPGGLMSVHLDTYCKPLYFHMFFISWFVIWDFFVEI